MAAKSVAFSPDGTLVVTGSLDGTVRLWSQPSGALVTRIYHSQFVEDVEFSPRANVLASGSRDGTVKILDLEEVEASYLPGERPLSSSPSGELVTVLEDVSIWSSVKTRQRLNGDFDRPDCLAYWPNDRIAVGCAHEIVMCSPNQAPRKLAAPADGKIRAIGPNEHVGALVSRTEGGPIVWNIATGEVSKIDVGLEKVYEIRVARFSTSGDQLCIGCGVAERPGEVQVWDVSASRPRKTNTMSIPYTPTVLAIHPEGRLLAVGDFGGGVSLWDLNDGTQLAYQKGHPTELRNILFSEDGDALVSSDGRTIRFWRGGTLDDFGYIAMKNSGMCLFPNENALAVGTKAGIKLLRYD